MTTLQEEYTVSDQTTTSTTMTSPITRRGVLKGAAAAGLAAGALHPKASKTFAVNYLQGAQVELSYGTWFMEEPGRGAAWQKVIDEFHAEQQEIRVNPSGANFNEWINNVIVQLQAGRLEYDIMSTTPDLVLRLLRAGVLTPLNSVLEANQITTLSPAHDYITVDGQVMGLDVVTVVFGLLYNKQIFDEAGITTLPTNVDEWVQVTTQLTERPNRFGIWAPHLLSQPETFWFQLQEWACPFGGRWAVGNQPQLTSEPILQAINLFKTMYDQAIPQGTDDATSLRMWAEAQVAQQLNVSAAVNQYKVDAPDVFPHVRSMPLPWESKESIARIHPIVVNNQSEKKDAGVEFVTWLYKPENYRMLLMEQLDVIPSYEVGGLEEYLGQQLWLEGGFENINEVTPPDMVGDFIFNNQEFGQIVINRVSEVLTAGRPIEDAMAQAQTEAEELAANLGI
jgi:ABC-type glycerol-3-phosphate transport system substrate-binding protein